MATPATMRHRRALTAAPRALLILATLVGFFAVGVPLQLCVLRLGSPAAAHALPRLFCRILLRLVGVAVEVGGAHPRAGAVLLAANHVSWIDIPALAGVLPFCFLAKAEVGSWPIVSAFAAVQGTVFVDRRRRRSIIPANRAMADRLAEGRCVLLFPEGTTLAGPLPGPFLSSHFAAAWAAGGAVPVQPVAILYDSPAAAWVGDETLIGHLWRTLRGPALRCRIRFGEPVALRHGEGRKLAAARSRAAVSSLLAGMGAAVGDVSCRAASRAVRDPPNDPLACPEAWHYERQP